MEIILLEKVHKLGNIGDKVNVRGGYGRNFLIPQGKAVTANAKNLANFELRRAELEAKAAASLKLAQNRAEKLNEVSIKIEAKASEEGKLFGSVGTREIADFITAEGVEVEKSEVLLPTGPLRFVGEYEVDLQFHSDVVKTVKVEIVGL